MIKAAVLVGMALGMAVHGGTHEVRGTGTPAHVAHRIEWTTHTVEGRAHLYAECVNGGSNESSCLDAASTGPYERAGFHAWYIDATCLRDDGDLWDCYERGYAAWQGMHVGSDEFEYQMYVPRPDTSIKGA